MQSSVKIIPEQIQSNKTNKYNRITDGEFCHSYLLARFHFSVTTNEMQSSVKIIQEQIQSNKTNKYNRITDEEFCHSYLLACFHFCVSVTHQSVPRRPCL